MRSVAVLFLLCGACNSYGRSEFWRHGYRELQVNQRTWHISADGMAGTQPSATREIALRRAAELTVWKGFSGFAVVDGSTELARHHSTAPTACETVEKTAGLDDDKRIATTKCTGGATSVAVAPTSHLTVTMLRTDEIAERERAGVLVYDAELLLLQLGTPRTRDGRFVIDTPPRGHPTPGLR